MKWNNRFLGNIQFAQISPGQCEFRFPHRSHDGRDPSMDRCVFVINCLIGLLRLVKVYYLQTRRITILTFKLAEHVAKTKNWALNTAIRSDKRKSGFRNYTITIRFEEPESERKNSKDTSRFFSYINAALFR